MSKIADLYAALHYKVNDKGLKQFQGQLQTLQKDINSKGGLTGAFQKAEKAQTSATKKAVANNKKQQKSTNALYNEIKKGYGKVRKSMDEAREDLQRLHGMRKRGEITAKEYLEARGRVQQKISDMEIQNQRKAAQQFNKIQADREKLYKKQLRDIEKNRKEEERANKSKEAGLKRGQNLLLRVERTLDKHNAQLRQNKINQDAVNQEYKEGNITLEQRDDVMNRLIAKEKMLREQIEQTNNASRAARIGAAGGIYAGGEDPRQVGHHRIISAIHSDVGLGMMMGGFAAAQSVQAYQEFVAMEQGLAAAMGSMEKGQEEVEWLTKLTNRLGVSLKDAADGYKNFAASTQGTELAGQQTRDVFEAVSSYSKVLNLTADDQKGVFRA